jgi:nitroreductase
MDAIEAILTRRSIRRYTDQPISPETVDELLKAAMAAPSAHNKQPWSFVVIDDHQLLEVFAELHSYSGMLSQAQLAILVCGDTLVQPERWMLDCTASAQNILLAAHAKGLGAVWVAVYPGSPRMKEVQTILKLPDHISPLCLISLGHPQGKINPSKRYDPAKIHKNQW